MSLPGDKQRYRDRQVRRRFFRLFDDAVTGDAAARNALARAWPELAGVCEPLLADYRNHYVESYRETAAWLEQAGAGTTPHEGPPAGLVQAALAAQELRSRPAPPPPPPPPKPKETQADRTRRVQKARFVDAEAERFVDTHDAIAVHTRLVADFLFSPDPITPSGIRSMDLLGSAVGRQHTGIGFHRKYVSVRDVAASLLFGMILDHPFHNGNKRTALVLMLQLLDRNHCYLKVTEAELFDFLIDVADHQLGGGRATPDEEVRAISDWLGDHLEHLDKHEYPLSVRDLLRVLERVGCTITSKQRTLVIRRGGRSKRMTILDLGKEIAPAGVHDIRKALGLLEKDGVTSAMFYGEAEPVDIWIDKYRKLLRDLANV